MRRSLRWLLAAAASTLLACPALAGPGERGSLLVLPYLVGTSTTTLHVSNTSGTTDYSVLLQFIDGDPGGDWRLTDFRCPLLRSESLRVVLSDSGGGISLLEFDCGGQSFQNLVPTTRGFVWVRLEDASTQTPTSDDVLMGNAVVDRAFTSFSVEAIAFQKGSGTNDGDAIYRFDGVEYRPPPRELLGSFRAVSSSRGTRAILAVIDGQAGVPQLAEADILLSEQDGTVYSISYAFDCFADVPLEDIDPRFSSGVLGSPTGSFRIRSVPRSSDGKTVAIVGWLVEERKFIGLAAPFASGRPMVWSHEPFVPSGGDPAPSFEGF